MIVESRNGIGAKRRSRLYIIADILNAAINGVVKTRIMYRVNINYEQFNDYVECLLETNLIDREEEERTIYQTTEKGELFLHRFKEIDALLEGPASEDTESLIVRKGPIYIVKKNRIR